jgi:hypothetical protein
MIEDVIRNGNQNFPVVPFADSNFYFLQDGDEFPLVRILRQLQNILQFFHTQAIEMQITPAELRGMIQSSRQSKGSSYDVVRGISAMSFSVLFGVLHNILELARRALESPAKARRNYGHQGLKLSGLLCTPCSKMFNYADKAILPAIYVCG